MKALRVKAIFMLMLSIFMVWAFSAAYSEESTVKKQKAHMIGHHHIDLIWLWPWEESVEVVRSTWQSVLDRMDENPDIRFIQTSAAAYKWVEDTDPAMFRKIAQRIREGRWLVIGGWWVEPDCNVPSGEAFVRQGLYGKRYFKEKFGVETDIGVNHDSFGHNWMLPQILAGMRIDKYIFMRPGPGENTHVPADVFWWEGPDGSRVLTYRISSYGTWGDDSQAIMNTIGEERKRLNPGLNDILVYYGMGNHGGVQTKELIQAIRDLKTKSGDVEIVFGDPKEFFESIEKSGVEFPVYRNDLQYHARGCYSTIASIKKMNRENENLLCSAEKMSVVANTLVKKEYPLEKLTESWRRLLFAQFHDILPGSSIQSAYTDVIAWHGGVRMAAREIINTSAQSIGAMIDTNRREGIPIVVWNSQGRASASPVEIELATREGNMPSHFGPARRRIGKGDPLPTRTRRGVHRRKRPSEGHFLHRHPGDGIQDILAHRGESRPACDRADRPRRRQDGDHGKRACIRRDRESERVCSQTGKP